MPSILIPKACVPHLHPSPSLLHANFSHFPYQCLSRQPLAVMDFHPSFLWNSSVEQVIFTSFWSLHSKKAEMLHLPHSLQLQHQSSSPSVKDIKREMETVTLLLLLLWHMLWILLKSKHFTMSWAAAAMCQQDLSSHTFYSQTVGAWQTF